MQTWFDTQLHQNILDGIYSADDVRSNNICCLSKLWQLRLALLSNVALLVWCHSRYFPTFIGHGKQRKYQNYFQCTNLATCIRSDTMKPKIFLNSNLLIRDFPHNIGMIKKKCFILMLLCL